jgi:hypothetical protein
LGNEVAELEKKMELTKTEKEKSKVGNQLGRAQVFLKEALIRLSVSQMGDKNDSKGVAEELGNQDKVSAHQKNTNDNEEEEEDNQSGRAPKVHIVAGIEYQKKLATTTKDGLRWADMSDDEDTVISGYKNRDTDGATEWTAVGNKHSGNKGSASKGNRGSVTEESKGIKNPYLMKHHTPNKNGKILRALHKTTNLHWCHIWKL